MGCNTSKDSFQPAVDEAKEDSVKNGDISKAAEDGAATAESDEKEKAAATKIQAVFRGHCARKSLKQPSKTASETEEDQKESPSDDKELTDAATKIQATFRGHMSRKEQAASAAAKSAMNMVGSAAAKIEEKMQDAVHELEGIDLADPDLHKAATKIQASFRGHKVRQEVSMHCTADESKK